MRQITPALLMGYREWRLSQRAWGDREGMGAGKARTVSPRTVNREVGTLNNMLNKGVEWRRIGSNPIKDLAPLRHDALLKDRRALSADEVGQIFEASPAYLRPVWRMFMCTAIRRAELVNMRFDDIDFDRQTVTVRASTAKNHKAREIPLDDEMLAMLGELQQASRGRCPIEGASPKQTAQQAAAFSRDHVFVTRANTPLRNNLLTRFYALCKRAGIEDAQAGGSVDIHSLRVTCATLMLQHGANPKDVQSILGHSTLALTMKVYARATESGKRSAVNALPFASSSTPAHIVSVQKVPKRDPSIKDAVQTLSIAGVA